MKDFEKASYCIKCPNRNENTCNECKEGYFLNNGFCLENMILYIIVGGSIGGSISIAIIVGLITKSCCPGCVCNKNLLNRQVSIVNLPQNTNTDFVNNNTNNNAAENNTLNPPISQINNDHTLEIEIIIKSQLSKINKYSNKNINENLIILVNNKNLCLVCQQNNGEIQTKCGCYVCKNDKDIITGSVDYKCPKCNIVTSVDKNNILVNDTDNVVVDEKKEMVVQLQSINISSCGICYDRNGDLASYHDKCGLKVCLDCHYRSLKASNLCPYCRKIIFKFIYYIRFKKIINFKSIFCLFIL